MLFIFLIIGAVIGCRDPALKRPYGYYNLGKISELQAAEIDMPQFKLLLRKDAKGYSVMSTMCTHDLTYLERKHEKDRELLVSSYTASKYDLSGIVVSGPATANLPYYNLRFEAGVYGGVKDSLFAEVGNEVPSTWRLQVK